MHCEYCKKELNNAAWRKTINYYDETRGPDFFYFCLESECLDLYHELWKHTLKKEKPS